MNKKEANIVLFSITFFWGIQYMFIKNVPGGMASTFSFLFLTNFIGFLIIAGLFFKELKKLTLKLIRRSALQAVMLFGFNVFLLLGSRYLESSITSFATAVYIIFIPLIMLMFKKKASKNCLIGIGFSICGLLFATGANVGNGFNPYILLIFVADIFFAVYIIVIDLVVAESNPILLAMGQMFFNSLFAIIGLIVMYIFSGNLEVFSIPGNQQFFTSVLIVALFIRAYTTVLQIYAQRYVTALNASLIFSTEIVFTLITSMFLPKLIGGQIEMLSFPKLIGCIFILFGVLISDETVFYKIINILKKALKIFKYKEKSSL